MKNSWFMVVIPED